MIGDMDQRKKVLGHYIAQRREELDLTQEDISDNGGPSPETLRQYELGKIPDTPQARTMFGIDRALSWHEGSTRDVLYNGGEPKPIATGPVRDKTTVSVNRDLVQQLVRLSAHLSDTRALRPEHLTQLRLIAAELAVQAMNQ